MKDSYCPYCGNMACDCSDQKREGARQRDYDRLTLADRAALNRNAEKRERARRDLGARFDDD